MTLFRRFVQPTTFLLGAPALIDPATLPLTSWLDSRDYVGATYPTEPTWTSRASAGTSGNYFFKRNDSSAPTATANPGTTTVGGNQVLTCASSSGYLRATASPATSQTMAAFLGSGSFFVHMVLTMTSTTNGPTASPNGQSAPFAPASGAGGVAIRCTTGPGVTASMYDATTSFAYQQVTAPIALSTLTRVQLEYDHAANTMRIRAGSGSWVSIATTGTNARGSAALLFASQLGGTEWAGQFAELITMASVAPGSAADDLMTRAASVWGAA